MRFAWKLVVMSMNKQLILALLSLVLASAVVAFAEEPKYPMKVVDSAGREVTIAEPVQRVIVLNTDSAEAVSALGASGMIAGLPEGLKDSYEFQGLKDRPSIGSWTDIDYEMIGSIAHKESNGSDLIVLGFVYPGKPNGIEAVSGNLASIGGIASLGLDFYKEENLSREMKLLGSILGREKEADEIIGWHDRRVAEVELSVSGLDQPKVYIEGSSRGLGDLSTFGSTSGTAMLLMKAGGENVMDKEEAYPKVDWEWVVSQNPDIIIKTDYLKSSDGMPGWNLNSNDTKKLDEIRNGILSRPGAGDISAVKNNRVYVVSAPSLFGLDNVAGLQRLAKILHPQMGLSPEDVYNEYIHFMGLKDMKDRIFVYPRTV